MPRKRPRSDSESSSADGANEPLDPVPESSQASTRGVARRRSVASKTVGGGRASVACASPSLPPALREVRRFLRSLTEGRSSAPFCTPVREDADGAEGYGAAVRVPMDLGTIIARIDAGVYNAGLASSCAQAATTSPATFSDSSPIAVLPSGASFRRRDVRPSRQSRDNTIDDADISSSDSTGNGSSSNSNSSTPEQRALRNARAARAALAAGFCRLAVDVERVWSNCLLFNGTPHPLTDCARRLRERCQTELYPRLDPGGTLRALALDVPLTTAVALAADGPEAEVAASTKVRVTARSAFRPSEDAHPGVVERALRTRASSTVEATQQKSVHIDGIDGEAAAVAAGPVAAPRAWNVATDVEAKLSAAEAARFTDVATRHVAVASLADRLRFAFVDGAASRAPPERLARVVSLLRRELPASLFEAVVAEDVQRGVHVVRLLELPVSVLVKLGALCRREVVDVADV